MKNVIKFLIILLIVIIVVLAILLFRVGIDENNNKSENTVTEGEKNIIVENQFLDEETPQDEPVELSKKTIKEKDDYVVFSINDAIQKYFNYINNNDNKKYYIQEVYTLQDYQSQVYYTYGFLEDNNKLIDYYLKVKVQNDLYLVETLDTSIYNEAKNGNINKIEEANIEKNEYNNYEYMYFSSKEIAEKYINDYILKMRYKTELAYNLLEDDYRKENFREISEFKKYINENVNRFKSFILLTCETNIKEDSTEYVVTDKSNNYYKIIVYSAMDYKIVLEK